MKTDRYRIGLSSDGRHIDLSFKFGVVLSGAVFQAERRDLACSESVGGEP
jgi:hypothetical protein